MKTRTHFAHRIERLDDTGELIETWMQDALAEVVKWATGPVVVRREPAHQCLSAFGWET